MYIVCSRTSRAHNMDDWLSHWAVGSHSPCLRCETPVSAAYFMQGTAAHIPVRLLLMMKVSLKCW